MAIFQSLVGQTAGPWRRSWTETDTALYALAVGAGQEELAWSTGQEALPTFGIVLAQFGAFAARGGFDRPILHGLCTYGITCRLLIREFCEASRVRRMFGRFSLPVVPGAELVVSAWRTGPGEVAFRTADSAGAVVLDRGAFAYS